VSEINISVKRLVELEDQERKLMALEAGGVDNWDNYGDALDEYHREKEESEAFSCLAEDICEELSSGAYEPSERGAGVAFKDDAILRVQNLIKTVFKDILNEREA